MDAELSQKDGSLTVIIPSAEPKNKVQVIRCQKDGTFTQCVQDVFGNDKYSCCTLSDCSQYAAFSNSTGDVFKIFSVSDDWKEV